MTTRYTFENLVNDVSIRAAFFRDYDKLIKGLKENGFSAVAIKHARNTLRIADELALLD